MNENAVQCTLAFALETPAAIEFEPIGFAGLPPKLPQLGDSQSTRLAQIPRRSLRHVWSVALEALDGGHGIESQTVNRERLVAQRCPCYVD